MFRKWKTGFFWSLTTYRRGQRVLQISGRRQHEDNANQHSLISCAGQKSQYGREATLWFVCVLDTVTKMYFSLSFFVSWHKFPLNFSVRYLKCSIAAWNPYFNCSVVWFSWYLTLGSAQYWPEARTCCLHGVGALCCWVIEMNSWRCTPAEHSCACVFCDGAESLKTRWKSR